MACAAVLALGPVADTWSAWWWQPGATVTMGAVVVSEAVVVLARGAAVPLVWAERAGTGGGRATGLALAASAGLELAQDERGVFMQELVIGGIIGPTVVHMAPYEGGDARGKGWRASREDRARDCMG